MSTRDDALDLMHALVLEDGRRWGEVATDFQREDAEAVLDPDSPKPYNFLTRARGSAKTSDLAGTASCAMLTQLPTRSRLYALAADKDQAALLIDSIGGYVARTPELSGALRIDSFRVTAERTGSTLDALAADAASAWGLRPDFGIVDELPMWPTTPSARRLFEAFSSAIAKREQARLALLGTSGDPAHWSRRVLDHAKADPLWRVHEVPGPSPWMSPEKLAEQRRRLPDSSYRRLFLNEWVSGEDRLASEAELAACVTHDAPLPPRPGVTYVCGLDIGIKHDLSAAAICHAERDGNGVRVVLDRLETWRGTRLKPVRLQTVEEWLADQCDRYNGARIIFDPSQAVHLAQRLHERGLYTQEFVFSAQSVGRIANTLLVLVRDGRLNVYEDEALLDELANVRLKETSPGVLRVDHDPGRHDDRVIAVGLAAQHLAERRPARILSVHVARGNIYDRNPWAHGGRLFGQQRGLSPADMLAGTPVNRRSWR